MADTKTEMLDVDLIKETVTAESSSGNPMVVVREKIVPPRDYEQLKQENRRLQATLRRQNALLMQGKVSDLSTMIDNYMAYSRGQIKKIALEISLMQHTDEDVAKVVMLANYFQSLHDSICEQCNFVVEDEENSNSELMAITDDLTKIADIAADGGGFLSSLTKDELINLRQPLKLFNRMVEDARDKFENSG